MNIRSLQSAQIVKFFQWICFFIFISRAYQHLVWDVPFRTFLWDEYLLKGLVEFIFPISWNEYVTNPNTDMAIQGLIKLNGLFYLLCAITCLFLHRLNRYWGYLILVGAFSLLFLAFLYTKEKFFHVGQFFEYTIQFSSPVLLYLLLFSEVNFNKMILFAKIAIALTFICHGLYAVGFYPLPGSFVDMTINTLHVDEELARNFLLVAGIMDFIVAFLLFVPLATKPALYYMIFWGLLTSSARLTANVYPEFFWPSLNQWWFEFLVRLPHALLPLMVILMINVYSKSRYSMTSPG